MLLVTKKPIENQMHCFLEIMKGKIDNEIVKCQELPLPFDMQI